MHHSGPLPQTMEGPEQGFRGTNCQNVRQRKPKSCQNWLFRNLMVLSSEIELKGT